MNEEQAVSILKVAFLLFLVPFIGMLVYALRELAELAAKEAKA